MTGHVSCLIIRSMSVDPERPIRIKHSSSSAGMHLWNTARYLSPETALAPRSPRPAAASSTRPSSARGPRSTGSNATRGLRPSNEATPIFFPKRPSRRSRKWASPSRVHAPRRSAVVSLRSTSHCERHWIFTARSGRSGPSRAWRPGIRMLTWSSSERTPKGSIRGSRTKSFRVWSPASRLPPRKRHIELQSLPSNTRGVAVGRKSPSSTKQTS